MIKKIRHAILDLASLKSEVTSKQVLISKLEADLEIVKASERAECKKAEQLGLDITQVNSNSKIYSKYDFSSYG